MSETSRRSVVIVAGPTASGKSALALAIAEEFNGTIINADSQQIYRDLAVLSARPDDETMARVPHRLYGAIDAAEHCSVGQWLALAQREIDAAQADGRVPILAGGTGLYFEALVNGLAELPPIPPEVRAEAQALRQQLGAVAFHARLAELDPVGAAKLVASDTQRLTRAYEVVRGTGKPLSAWQRDQAPNVALDAAALVLLPEREALYRACDARVLAMMERGAVEEVRALLARHLAPELPAMKAVGVREIGAWLAEAESREAAIAAMQQATRNYAKRQYTWFRRRLGDGEKLRRFAISEQFSESIRQKVFSFIRQTRLTSRA